MSKCRLHTNAVFMGFQRSQRNQYPNVALLKVDGVNCREDVPFYIGKRVAYIYKVSSKKTGKKSTIKAIPGKIVAPHGNSGVVKARFRHNLPPKAMGQTLQVFLYPSNI
ncbi:60S ribosomal protein L35a [Entamoeba marina]